MKMDQREDDSDQVHLDQKPPRVCLNLASISPLVNDSVVDAYEKQPQARQRGRNDKIEHQFWD